MSRVCASVENFPRPLLHFLYNKEDIEKFIVKLY